MVFLFFSKRTTKIRTEEVSSLKSLLKCHSVKELSLKRCRISPEAVPILCDLASVNSSLTSLDFSYMVQHSSQSSDDDFFDCDSSDDESDCLRQLSDDNFSKLLSSIQSNPHLRTVNLSHNSFSFKQFLKFFELISTGNLIPSITVFPHCLDVSCGHIRFDGKVENSDLISLLTALKSNIPIRCVECRGLKSLSLDGFIALLQILVLKKSVIDLDISPHAIDVENGVFCFSPLSFKQMSAETVLTLKFLLNCFTVKELTLKRCRFSFRALHMLCDLIKASSSLTFLDLSYF
ncbi:hypothetical protein GEMRC1_009490 [Eukaryota sp. GEM-RC1]